MWQGNRMSENQYNKGHERTDKISGLLGQYMLQGYRMLGSCCEKCGTVLLKYRDKDDYCVACFEVDVVQEPANKTTLDEHQAQHPHSLSTVDITSPSPPNQLPDTPGGSLSKTTACNAEVMDTAVSAIKGKILWASNGLKNCHSTEESIHLCNLIKACCETLKVLQGQE